MGLSWRRWWGVGLSMILVAGLAFPGWTAEPFPPPPPEPPTRAPEASGARDAPDLTDEERAVVKNMEFLEAMDLLEHLDVLRDWDVATTPARAMEGESPQPEGSSYGDVTPR